MTADAVLALSLNTALMLFALATALAFVRLWLGPKLADRVVALDVMSAGIIGFCALYAVKTGLSAYLDIALALALVSFLSVVALARYALRLAIIEDAP